MMMKDDMTEGRYNTIYQCSVCHTRTNLWIEVRWYSNRRKAIFCPGEEYVEHVELYSKLKGYDKLAKQIKEFEETLKESPRINQKIVQDMMEGLYAKRILLEEGISLLRQKFGRRLDDIMGVDSDVVIQELEYNHGDYICRGKRLEK